MAKRPQPGRVKTRLASEIGTISAAWWFRHQLDRLVRRLSRDPRWRTVLAVSPDGAVLGGGLPGGVRRQAQGPGDLGQRMLRALTSQPPGPAVLVGADIPAIEPRHIARAFEMLGQFDAVLGPSGDGGYWMVGLRRAGAGLPRGTFAGVRWSSQHALTDTVASLAPLRTGFADPLDDVDSLADLQRAAAPARSQQP